MTDNITIPRATVQQALEALERITEAHGEWTNGMWAANKALNVTPALKSALEQPEQEHAGAFNDGVLEGMLRERVYWLRQQEQTNLWRDAVDHELSTLHMVASDDPQESIRRLIDWHCAVQIDPLVSSAAQELIERGRREVLEQPEKEPVAWQVHPFDYGIGYEGVYAITQRPDQVKAWERKGWTVQPLYTHPPRQWQGLTEEEVFHVENNVPDSVISDRQWTVYFARALENKLRAKNSTLACIQGGEGSK